MRERRILLLSHEFLPYPGGVGRYCWSLSAAAARLGHRITVLAPEHEGYRSPEYQDPPGVEVLRFPGDVFHFRDLSRVERVVHDVLEWAEWDIVHAADWPMIMALRRLHRPQAEQVVSLHGSDVLLLRHSLRARLAGARRALNRFDRYVCNSRYTASLLRKEFPALADAEIRVAPLGVDPWWFEEPSHEDIDAFYERISRRPGERIVLTVARLDERKGHLAVLSALARLPEQVRGGIKYVCIGRVVDAAYARRIVAMAEAAGVSTVLTGALADPEVRAAYRGSDILALCGQTVPRKVEGFGLVVLEAAAQGLPALVTRVQALPEVVQHERTGWICEERDTDGWADVLSRALRDTSTREMRAACIAHARMFQWDRCAEATYTAQLAEAA